MDASPSAGKAPLRVVDTSALLSGRPLTGDLVAPDSLASEVSRGGPEGRALAYLEGAGLRYMRPGAAAMARVREAATRSGDAGRLSVIDVEVLAVALETGGELLTDDYSIQNVARVMGLPYSGVAQRGIQEVFTWTYRCVGCRRVYETAQKDCPVCGSEVRTARKR